MYNFVTLSQNIHTSLSWKLKGKKREEIKKRKVAESQNLIRKCKASFFFFLVPEGSNFA